MLDQFPTFWGKVPNEKITESRSHPVSGIWWKMFWGPPFVKSENVFYPQKSKYETFYV